MLCATSIIFVPYSLITRRYYLFKQIIYLRQKYILFQIQTIALIDNNWFVWTISNNKFIWIQ